MGTPVTCGNRGVLALGVSLVNLNWNASHGGDISLLLGNKDNMPVSLRVGGERRLIPVVNYRMSPRSRPREHFAWILLASVFYRLFPFKAVQKFLARSTPWIHAVASADLVGDIRGGDSFSDIYGMKRFLHSFLVIWSVLLVRGTIVQFPQTYGPYKSPLARCLARYLLKRSNVIIARDEQSRKVAQDLVGAGNRVLLSPDVAFSLEAVQPKQIETIPPMLNGIPKGVVGLNVNGLMYNGGYTRNNMFGLELDYVKFLSELCIALLQVNSGELWLIPHTYAPMGSVESDNECSEKLRDSLPQDFRGRVRIVTGDYDQHEIKWIIGQCEFFIGSRMHACIAALSQGVPCVGVAYSMKFGGVFDSVGMGEWVVDARSVNNAEAASRITSLYRQRNEVRQALRKRANEARVKLEDVFRDLLKPYNSACAPNRSNNEVPQTVTRQ